MIFIDNCVAFAKPSAFVSATTVFEQESGAVGGGLAKYHLHIAKLFHDENAPECVVDSCNAALLATAGKVWQFRCAF